jgi:hypothetical protein
MKKVRKLNCTEKLGAAWYRGFLNHYEDVLTRNGSAVIGIKRRTWVTSKFLVYEIMVLNGE